MTEQPGRRGTWLDLIDFAKGARRLFLVLSFGWFAFGGVAAFSNATALLSLPKLADYSAICPSRSRIWSDVRPPIPPIDPASIAPPSIYGLGVSPRLQDWFSEREQDGRSFEASRVSRNAFQQCVRERPLDLAEAEKVLRLDASRRRPSPSDQLWEALEEDSTVRIQRTAEDRRAGACLTIAQRACSAYLDAPQARSLARQRFESALQGVLTTRAFGVSVFVILPVLLALGAILVSFVAVWVVSGFAKQSYAPSLRKYLLVLPTRLTAAITFFSLIVVPLVAAGTFVLMRTTAAPSESPSPPKTDQRGTAIVSSNPQTGIVSIVSRASAVAPLTVLAPTDASVFLKIVVAETSEPVVTAFIRSGEKLDAMVPLGRFEIRYAYGKSWIDDTQYFGSETQFAKAEKVFDFAEDAGGISGYDIELTLQPNGNLSTQGMPKSAFE